MLCFSSLFFACIPHQAKRSETKICLWSERIMKLGASWSNSLMRWHKRPDECSPDLEHNQTVLRSVKRFTIITANSIQGKSRGKGPTYPTSFDSTAQSQEEMKSSRKTLWVGVRNSFIGITRLFMTSEHQNEVTLEGTQKKGWNSGAACYLWRV